LVSSISQNLFKNSPNNYLQHFLKISVSVFMWHYDSQALVWRQGASLAADVTEDVARSPEPPRDCKGTSGALVQNAPSPHMDVL
jgi:hypothetical protein